MVYTTQRTLHIAPKVTINCSASNQTDYEWMLSKINPKTKTFGKFLMAKRKTIQLIPLKFDAEILFVALKVMISGVPGTSSYAFGFIRIRRPELVAKINGPKSISRNDTEVRLNSTGSCDPEAESLQNKGLNFAWKCQRKCPKSFLDTLSLTKVESEPCFGIANESESVFSTESEVAIEVASLKFGCTYFFELSVIKDSRVANAEHALEVKSKVPFFIR